MNKFPLVSILIPMYNAEKYIEETLNSCINQTYKNIEIIVVDDESKDNSLKIVTEISRVDKRVKIFEQKNSGAARARNRAFELSSGEYIQYFDADDIMHTNKIKTQIDKLSLYNFSPNVVATGKWNIFYDSVNSSIENNQIINKDYSNRFLYFKESWENGEFIIGQSWLIHRDLNTKINGWDETLTNNDDGEFFTRVAFYSEKIVFVEKSIVYYRKGIETSLSSQLTYDSTKSRLESVNKYKELVNDYIEEHSLSEGLINLYSKFYVACFPLEQSLKIEFYKIINSLGYAKPKIYFQKKYQWLVYFIGIDNTLAIKNKLNNLRNL